MKSMISSFAFFLLFTVCFSRPVGSDTAYLGQIPPGKIPQIFAPGIISLNNRLETYPAFSPDGREMFFSVVNSAWTAGKILHTREANGSWAAVDTADFSNNGSVNWESFLSPDGNRQFFTSNRQGSSGTDIWSVDRISDSSWTSPVHLDPPVNSASSDGSACVTNNGTLYFKSLREGGIGGSILYRSKPVAGTYSQAESMGAVIPTGPGESEPFIAPDESYMIFISETRPGGKGGWDLWISFMKPDSSWTNPVNMGADINSQDDEYGPRVTTDGKYLFFTREKRGSTMDIYWASSGIIDSLRSVVLPASIPTDSLYFGQVPPGDSAILFAPGSISLSNRREAKIAFSPDNMECLISIGQNNTFTLLYSDFRSGYWKTPLKAPFISTPRSIEPFYSPDSVHLFFTSYADIYMSTRVNQTWSAPVLLGSPINTAYEEYHPTSTSNSKLYFCSKCENSAFAIYSSVFENGAYSKVEKMPDVINHHDTGSDGAYDPFIAPDESYIIFSSIRTGGYGQEDQYISYNRNGNWTNPKNLGPSINTAVIEYGSYVSPDNKYYFFSRPAGWGPGSPADIYWIRIDRLIDSLRYTNFIPYLKNKINDQNDTTGHLFNFTLPDSTFVDDDGNNTLTFRATLNDGSPLPSWLAFDSISAEFTGVAPTEGLLNIRVMARDPYGASVSAVFKLHILKSNSVGRTLGDGVMIFPNPAKGVINISFESSPGKLAKVEIRNLDGKLILDESFKNELRIDLSGVPKGIYLLTLLYNNEKISEKVLLE